MNTNTTIATPLKEYKFKEKGKLIITPRLAAQIDALHKAHPNKEWSGILIFEPINQEITEPDEVILKALAVFPMDFGSPGYTEYEVGEEILTVYELFPETDPSVGTPTLRLGQIHSHHNMSSFFSGTDERELKDNAGKYEYYLSLIVNHSGQYVAKVAFEATVPKTVAVKPRGQASNEVEYEDVLAHFELDIVKEVPETEQWFKDQIKVLEAKPKKHYTMSEYHAGTVNQHPYSRNSYPYNNQYPYSSPYNAQRNMQDGFDGDYGIEYETRKGTDSKKATEKEEKSTTGSGTRTGSPDKCPITREQVRAALPHLFRENANDARIVSALLVLANHPLNDDKATVEQREQWVAGIIMKIEEWMYEHFYNELLMDPDNFEYALLETVYDIIQLCSSESPVANLLAQAIDYYMAASYPGIYNENMKKI